MSNPAMLRFMCILALALAILPYYALAQEAEPAGPADASLSKYYINMYVGYNKVLVDSAMLFDSRQTTNFSVELPFDARAITNKVDGFGYPAILESNNLLFYLVDNKDIRYSYITNDLLEKDTFIASLTAPFDTSKFRLKLSLPEKTVLEKPVRKGTVSGTSIYPKPKRLETDGRVITVVWEFNDVKKDDELSFYVKYKKPVRYLLPLVLVVIGVLAILAITAYLVYRSNGRKRSRTKEVVKEAEVPEKDIETHLKEDERQIVNVLKLKEGRCEQGTLRIATGFSKAKLSGLLKEMQERKIIQKEKRGKKNLVFLK